MSALSIPPLTTARAESSGDGARSGSGDEFAGPVFITGMWRSGSSLLYALLNKHPQVGLMYEADLALLRPVFHKPGAAGWADRWEFWNGAVRRHGLEPAALQSPTAEESPTRSLEGAFLAAYRQYAQRKGATVWGDKSPDLYDRMTLLAGFFPQARFVVVWRSPAATCSSMAAAAAKGASFFRKPGMGLRGLLGCAELRRQCDLLRAAGRPVCEVDYEDLVKDPRTVVRRVCEFIGVAYDDSLATLEGANRDSIHSGEHHALLRGTRIVDGPRPQLLEEPFRRKIDRYVNWWRQRSHGDWPKYPVETEAADVPGLFERLWDRAVYRWWRGMDAFTRLAFCWAPLSWLRWYRHRKRGSSAGDN